MKPTKFGIEVEFHDKTRVLQDMQRRFGLLGERRDGEAQQVHIHFDMHGSGMEMDIRSPAIDVTPKLPKIDASAPTEAQGGHPPASV